MSVKMPVNVIRIEAAQQAECFRFNVEVCHSDHMTHHMTQWVWSSHRLCSRMTTTMGRSCTTFEPSIPASTGAGERFL